MTTLHTTRLITPDEYSFYAQDILELLKEYYKTYSGDLEKLSPLALHKGIAEYKYHCIAQFIGEELVGVAYIRYRDIPDDRIYKKKIECFLCYVKAGKASFSQAFACLFSHAISHNFHEIGFMAGRKGWFPYMEQLGFELDKTNTDYYSGTNVIAYFTKKLNPSVVYEKVQYEDS